MKELNNLKKLLKTNSLSNVAYKSGWMNAERLFHVKCNLIEKKM